MSGKRAREVRRKKALQRLVWAAIRQAIRALAAKHKQVPK